MKLDRVEEKTDRDHSVHYASVGVQDAITLCNVMCFENMNESDVKPIPTRKKVTCHECLGIVRAVQSADKEKI